MFIKQLSEETAALALFLPSEILLKIDLYNRSRMFKERVKCLERQKMARINYLVPWPDRCWVNLYPYRFDIQKGSITVWGPRKDFYHPIVVLYRRQENMYNKNWITQQHIWYEHTDEYPYTLQSWRDDQYRVVDE
jgi:hypothetical protein